MPFISGGGGGGGGVTPPVTITGTDAGTTPLKIVDAAAQSADSLLVQDTSNNNLLQVGPGGGVTVSATAAAIPALFSVFASGGSRGIWVRGNGAGDVGDITLRTAGSHALLVDTQQLDLGASGVGTYTYLESANVLFIGASAAPADGDLSAGNFALWLDATNGAAKLMVKAKQANGTVVAAAIALA